MPSLPLVPGVGSLHEIDAFGTYSDTETVVIQGLVAARNQSAWPLGGDGHEVHCFEFSDWRRLAGPLRARRLLVFRAVPQRVDLENAIPKLSIQRFRVWLSSDESRSIVESAAIVDAPDEPLLARARKQRKTVTARAGQLGRLVLNRATESFEVTADWNGQPTEVTIAASGDRPAVSAMRTAEELWSGQAQWAVRIRGFAAEQLLALRNGDWRPEDAPVLTSAEFIAGLAITSIAIDINGEFHFWFRESDLSYMIRGDVARGPMDAAIYA